MKTVLACLIRGILLLFAVSIIAFVLANLSPTDPIQQYISANPGVSEANIAKMEAYWGLNVSPVERYFTWLGNLLHGDWGTSTSMRRPVIEIISTRFLASLALMATAWIFSGVIGFGIGCVMGANKDRLIDRILEKICLFMCAFPTFWIGLVFLTVFAAILGWFPFGMAGPLGVPAEDVTLLQRIHHLVLPALTLSFLSFANLALITRTKLVEVIQSDYVLFAKARGEKPLAILFRHCIRNIAIPSLTYQFCSFSELFGGSVFAENIFSYPGLGAAVTAAGLGTTDMPLFLGIVLFSALFVFVGNTIANLLYSITNPATRQAVVKQ